MGLKIRSGMRGEIILSGPRYAVFHGRDAGCFEIDGGIDDHTNPLMIEKTPNNDHLYERNNNLCVSGLPVTYNQCVLVLEPAHPGARSSYHNTSRRMPGHHQYYYS